MKRRAVFIHRLHGAGYFESSLNKTSTAGCYVNVSLFWYVLTSPATSVSEKHDSLIAKWE